MVDDSFLYPHGKHDKGDYSRERLSKGVYSFAGYRIEKVYTSKWLVSREAIGFKAITKRRGEAEELILNRFREGEDIPPPPLPESSRDSRGKITWGALRYVEYHAAVAPGPGDAQRLEARLREVAEELNLPLKTVQRLVEKADEYSIREMNQEIPVTPPGGF